MDWVFLRSALFENPKELKKSRGVACGETLFVQPKAENNTKIPSIFANL